MNYSMLVPLSPDSINKKAHWAARSRATKRFFDLVVAQMIQDRVLSDFLGKRAPRARMTICRYYGGGRTKEFDNDNLVAAYKPIVDGFRDFTDAELKRAQGTRKKSSMVRLGFFLDDAPECLEVTYRQEKDPGKPGFTLIEIDLLFFGENSAVHNSSEPFLPSGHLAAHDAAIPKLLHIARPKTDAAGIDEAAKHN